MEALFGVTPDHPLTQDHWLQVLKQQMVADAERQALLQEQGEQQQEEEGLVPVPSAAGGAAAGGGGSSKDVGVVRAACGGGAQWAAADKDTDVEMGAGGNGHHTNSSTSTSSAATRHLQDVSRRQLDQSSSEQQPCGDIKLTLPATSSYGTKAHTGRGHPVPGEDTPAGVTTACARLPPGGKRLPAGWRQAMWVLRRSARKWVNARSVLVSDVFLTAVLALVLGAAQGSSRQPQAALIWLIITVMAFGCLTLIRSLRSFGPERIIFLQRENRVRG
jgi:hypothetical protein